MFLMAKLIEHYMAKPGPKMKVTDDDLVEAIKTIDGPYAVPVEVAEVVDLTPEHTRERLKRLEGRVLNTKQTGHMRGYWLR